MNGVLEWPGHKWIQRGEKVLTRYLRHHHDPRRKIQSLDVQLKFVPEEFAGTVYGGEHRTLFLELHTSVPRTGDWRDLFGLRLGGPEPEHDWEPEPFLPDLAWPQIHLWSCGATTGQIQTHGREFWDVTVEFGRPEGDDEFELPISIEAFRPSDRALAAWKECIEENIGVLFGAARRFDPEREELLKEGWWLRYTGTVQFSQVFCTVPVNAADPVGWAKALAKRELKLTEFGRCQVNGSNATDGQFKPEDGVSKAGRLVILNPLTAYWKQRLAEQKR